MKKSIIAAGAASVALAAMPIMGAFAFEDVSDNITAVIDDGCLITDAVQNKTVNVSVALGGVGTSIAAPSISVTCNNNAWHVTAVGAGDTTGGKTATSLYSGTNEIVTGTATSGATSNWAFKVASLGGVDPSTPEATIASGFNQWHAIPASTAQGTIVNGTAAANVTVNTQYQVYAALGQAAGNYTGKVTYTVAENN